MAEVLPVVLFKFCIPLRIAPWPNKSVTRHNGCRDLCSNLIACIDLINVPGGEPCGARHDGWVVHDIQVQVGDSVWLQPPWSPSLLAQGQVAAVATLAAAGRVLPLTLQVGLHVLSVKGVQRLPDS